MLEMWPIDGLMLWLKEMQPGRRSAGTEHSDVAAD